MLRDLYLLDLEAGEILRTIDANDRNLASFLHNLNKRVELLGRTVAATETAISPSVQTTRISEGGISFVTNELLPVESTLALKLLFKQHLLGLTCFGSVKHCRLVEDGEAYVTGINFIDLDAQSQKLLSRHIIRRQSEERRARLRHNHVDLPFDHTTSSQP